MNRVEAKAALDAIDGAHSKLAEVGFCPPWRHAAFGLILGGLVLALGLGGTSQITLTVVAMAALAAVAIDDRRRYGVFINGYRRGPTLKVTLALLAVTIVLCMAQIHAREEGMTLATKLGLAAAEAIIAIAASVQFARVLRAELTARA